mmetsp:Transcript_48867/g.95541  ORF Transcript_48867/g.95541 Transcript_48867/m.95541 type:complete len:1422 (+) Transcript_48867:209-4474(+)
MRPAGSPTMCPAGSSPPRTRGLAPWYLPLFLFFSTVCLPVASASAPDNGTGTDHNYYSDGDDPCTKSPRSSLPCYLYSLVVPIPDTSMKSGFITMELTEGSCTHFKMSRITSSGDPASAALGLGLQGLGASCSLHFHVTGGTHGDVAADLAPGQSHVDFGLHSNKKTWKWDADGGGYTVPAAVSVSRCDSHVMVPSDGVHFSGSIAADILKPFASLVAGSVTKEINKMVCGQDTLDQINSLLTEEVKQVTAATEGLIVAATDGTVDPPAVPTDVAWVEWEKWTGVANAVGRWTDAHARTGIFPPLPAVVETERGDGPAVSVSEEETLCSYLGGGVSGLLMALTGGTGTVTIGGRGDILPLNFTLTSVEGYGTLVLSLAELEIGGLGSLSGLDFGLESHNAFFGKISASKVSLRANATVYVLNGDELLLREEFSIRYAATDANTAVRALLGIDREKIGRLALADVIMFGQQREDRTGRRHGGGIRPSPPVINWGCILPVLTVSALTDFRWNATVDDLTVTTLHSKGLLEDDIDRVLDHASEVVYGAFPEFVRDGIDGAVQGPLRNAINDAIAAVIARSSDGSTCHNKKEDTGRIFPWENSKDADMFRFDESWAIVGLARWLNDAVGPRGFNSVLSCFARHLPGNDDGDIVVRGPFSLVEWDGGSVTLDNVTVRNAATFTDFDILSPQDPHRIFSSLALGNSAPLGLSATLTTTLSPLGLVASVTPALALSSLSLSSGVLARYDLRSFGALVAGEALASPVCLAAPLENVRFYGTDGSLESLSAGVRLDVTGPGGGATYGVELPETVAATISEKMSNALNAAEIAVNSEVRNAVRAAPYVCTGEEMPHAKPEMPDPNGWRGFNGLTLAYLSVSAIFVGVLLVRGRTASEWGGTSATSSLEEDFLSDSLMEPLISDYKDAEEFLRATPTAAATAPPPPLIFHDSVPVHLRILVPSVILAAIVLFVFSNVAVGGSVEARIASDRAGGFDQKLSFYDCSLANTVADMWTAKVYPLSVLIALLSGVWPYVKLLAMLFAFAAPNWVCSEGGRERILVWLDALGKYSLIDAYVLVVTMVAFTFHFEPMELVTADIYVAPRFGFYGFLTATIISLVMGHVILYFHRRSAVRIDLSWLRSAEREPAFCNHRYVGEGVQFTATFKVLVAATMVLLFVLLAVGVQLECFAFDIGGVAGVVLGDEYAQRKYSLVSLGQAIPWVVGHEVGIGAIKATYFLFALVMPFSCLGILFVIFFVPLRAKTQVVLFVAAEVANAWGALEVFVFSMVAALLELSQFAAFIVQDYCSFINPILGQVMGDQLGGDNVCFSVRAKILLNSWPLMSGAILYCVVASSLLKLSHVVLEENIRENAAAGGEDANIENAEPDVIHFPLGVLLRSDWFVIRSPPDDARNMNFDLSEEVLFARKESLSSIR